MPTTPEPGGAFQASISPWLSVGQGSQAVAWYMAAFGAVQLERLEDEAGNVVVANLSIGGADLWLQEDPDPSPGTPTGGSVRMIPTVEDPDPLFEGAVAAGATEIAAVSEGHGWRIGRVADPFGHHWEIGRRLVDTEL